MKKILGKTWSKTLAFVLLLVFVICTIVMSCLIVASHYRGVYKYDDFSQIEVSQYNDILDGYGSLIFHRCLDDIYNNQSINEAEFEAELERTLPTKETYFYFEAFVNGKRVCGTYNNQKTLPAVTSQYSEYIAKGTEFFDKTNTEINPDEYSEDGENRLAEFEIVIYPKTDAMSAFKEQNASFLKETKIMFDNRNLFIALTVTFVLLGFICFIYLLCAAGIKEGAEGISLNRFDKIPMDILLAALLLICGFTFQAYRSSNIWFTAVAILGVISVPVCMSLSARIKAGKWWRNTLIYKIIMTIAKGMTFADAKISKEKVFIKAILIGLVIMFVQFITIWFEHTMGGRGVILMLCEVAILVPIIATVLLWINKLKSAAASIAKGDLSYKVNTENMKGEFKHFGENLNSISDGMNVALEEKMKSERLKTELITNVSHDIKTPLTSIINYVDLIEKEKTDNEKINEYTEVLSRQSEKLKKLIIDLMDASKISAGSVELNPVPMDICVIATQLDGEYREKFEAAGLDMEISTPQKPIYIMADDRHIQRIFDNLLNNAIKYSLNGTRVYIDVEERENTVQITIKNMSKYKLNISPEELMERFVRGDSSRHTQGNGLGLSIAQSLAQMMDGSLKPVIDGDLFKVIIEFKVLTNKT